MALTRDRLREVLFYDPATGIFTWVSRHNTRIKVGTRAGFRGGPGYRQIRIDGIAYFEHRLACLYMNGEWPLATVDHINGIKDHNQWDNLREASYSQNSANSKTKTRDKETSKLKGVCLDKARNKWMAFIKVNGKSKYLGTFPDEISAHAAYNAAATTHFGEFGRVA